MWEHLLASILLEKSGFYLENNYEETLNQYFLQNPENDFLLELVYISSDLEKSLHMLKKDCAWHVKKYDRQTFASIICNKLEEIYGNTTLKEFVPCAYKLWQILPICQYTPPLSDLSYINVCEKNMERADATYREMFRYYSDGFDRTSIEGVGISIREYSSISPETVEPDFERAEMLLGFKLNDNVKAFYSRVFAQEVYGDIVIPEEGFTIPIGNNRFDTWFRSSGIDGRTEIRLFPCTCPKSSARFIRDHFYIWTNGNNFGERVLIGELSAKIGQISIVINNQTGAVEWVDCGYGHYDRYDKNPNGILTENIDQFFQKISKFICV